ncbi:PTS sugar transporter subunit IIB [Collinsella vaginalis]|uniref:PTS sugar transporter subunit IIB n=1 Tax=Collinsella vaginalis TaxID=1870987 RepID=UPI000A2671A3|nr:PTS sugar transporter subunit IIB [Collinsella vaginalis]
MPKSELKVLVACGSGVATSTVAQEAVKRICKQAGIPISITKSTMNEIQSMQDIVDVIMVTTNYRKPVTKPLIKVFGLISGINQESVEKEIVDTCTRLLNES